MSPSKGNKALSKEGKESSLRALLTKLKKRHIIETFAGFIAGGWLFLEFVDRILVAHYHIHEKWLDVSFITLLGALLCIVLWRWFSGTEKRPGNVKVGVLIVPLVILVALAIDLNLILQVAAVPGKKLLIGIAAFLLGIAWVIFKSLQWAASTTGAAARKFDISKLAEIKPEKSIVVLPFKNMSPEEGQGYFCDGMTEELITKLSKVLPLRVISRTSAFIFKDTQKNVRDIALELNVGYVLEGSVRKAGNKLRIAAHLIDAKTDAHLRADTYEGVLEDVFDIQEKVARTIVDMLKLKLIAPEGRQISKRPIANVQAYDFYLRARSAYLQFTKEGLDEAVQPLGTGLRIMGDNALLYAALGYVYEEYVRMGVKQQDVLAKAEQYARKALDLDPDTILAHIALGLIHYLRGNSREFVYAFKKALSLDPNDIETIQWVPWSYILVGRTVEAFPLIDRLNEMDPLNPRVVGSSPTRVTPFFPNFSITYADLCF